jgi:FMN reductase
MKIATILGSVRRGNYTGKALAIMQDELKNLENVEVIEIDPDHYNLTLPGQPKNEKDHEIMNKLIGGADGIVLSTPEYNGSYSSTIKLVIDNLSYPGTFKNKPIVLLGVADGKIGAIKALEHIRSVCAHLGGLVLPRTISLANVQSIFDKNGNCNDKTIEERLRSLSRDLIRYIKMHKCPDISDEQDARS